MARITSTVPMTASAAQSMALSRSPTNATARSVAIAGSDRVTVVAVLAALTPQAARAAIARWQAAGASAAVVSSRFRVARGAGRAANR